MGVSVGVVMGLFGIGILIAAFSLQIYIRSKTSDKNSKRALEYAAGFISVSTIFFLGGIILAAYFSGKEIAATGAKYTGEGGKFVEKHPALLMLAA